MARKTSIYLTDEMEERVKASGVGLPELVRRGLDSSGPQPIETVVARALRSALDEYCAGHRKAPPEPPAAAGAPPVPASELALPVPFIPPPAQPVCRHPADQIQEDGTCGVCGEDVF
jgi:hypothetical protein